MLLTWIERLRERPKYIRVQYAFTIAVAATLCILFFWIWHLFSEFAPTPDATTTRETESSFLQELGQIVDSLQEWSRQFTGRIEYTNKSLTQERPTVIDLDALVASSSIVTTPTEVDSEEVVGNSLTPQADR